MGKRADQLKRLKQEFDAKYDPKTAVGNEELGVILQRTEQIEKELEGHRECDTCDGWGSTECDSCGQDKTCGDCDGEGLIET